MTKIFERLKQLVCAVISFLAIFAQRLVDNLLKLSGSVRDVTRERRWLRLQDRIHHLLWYIAIKRHMPRHHLIKHHAQTPDIGALINRRAERLFRRHVTGASQYRPQIGLSECHRFCPVRRSLGEGGFGKLCNPKVEHFHVPVRPEHDVLRFDIAMNNSGFVCSSERTGHLDGDLNSFTQLHPSMRQTLTQCLAFDQFARYVVNRVIFADLVNGQNIWMIERNHCVRFLLKPLETLGVAGKTQGQEFERGLTSRDNIGGEINFAHPAGAYRFRNFVVADRLTDERISLPILNNLGRQTDG